MAAQKIAVITFNDVPRRNYTFKYERLGPLALKNHEQYCRMHGYEFIQDVSVASDRPACWAKIPAIVDALDEFDWILWADSDALITNMSKRVEDFCDSRYDIVTQSPRDHFEFIGSDLATGLRVMPINTSVFLVRSTSWAKEFFKQSYDQTNLISHDQIWNGIGDQEAVTQLLKKHPNDFNRIRYSDSLQSHPKFYMPSNLCVHFFGNHAHHRIPLDGCEKILREWEQAAEREQPFPLHEMARFHWACIQNKRSDCPVVRGDLGLFLYTAKDIEDESRAKLP